MREKENREIGEAEFKDALKDIVQGSSESADFFAEMDRVKPDAARFLVNGAAGAGTGNSGDVNGAVDTGAEISGDVNDAADVGAEISGDVERRTLRRTRMSKRRKIGFALSAACVVLLCTGLFLSDAFSVRGPLEDELNADSGFGDADSLHYIRGNADYGNIYEAFEIVGSQSYRNELVYLLGEIEAPVNPGGLGGKPRDAVNPAEPPDAALPGAAGETDIPEYSDTNIQTEGVQEADVVKTDGRYIYTINSENLCIIAAKDGKPELLSKISQPTNSASSSDDPGAQVYFEMYILKDRIVALRQGTNAADYDGRGTVVPGDKNAIDYPENTGTHTDTSVDVFDISDPAHPKLRSTLSQSGGYTDSRMIGDRLYLVTNFWDFDLDLLDEAEPRSFVPLFAENGKQLTCAPEEIAISPDYDTLRYTVVSGIDTQTGSFMSKESIFGNNYTVYAAANNLYLMATRTNEQIEDLGVYTSHNNSYSTLLTRLSLADGIVRIAASAEIPGMALNRFSLDERNEVLCVVVTEYNWTYNFENYDATAPTESGEFVPVENDPTIPAYVENRSSALYTLDMKLNPLGSVTNLAPGEQVYSARFLEDMVYFVTFRQVDPLFSVDLSDPRNPRVLGALKIPGFSEYLHPYANGLLLGFGKDANAQTGVPGALKLSMFDHGDPADVTEKHKLILDGLYNSEASYNPKAILVDAGKQLVAFPADEYYMVYAYDSEKGFARLAQIQIPGAQNGEFRYEGYRGMFIGAVFYVVSPNRIAAFDMNDGYKKIGELSIGENAGPVVVPYINPGEGELIPLTESNQSP